MSDDSALSARQAAERRLRAQLNFKRLMMMWAFLIVLVIVVWALSGGGYFWPAWVIFGLAISGFWAWFAAYGPNKSPTEGQIQAEMRRQQAADAPPPVPPAAAPPTGPAAPPPAPPSGPPAPPAPGA